MSEDIKKNSFKKSYIVCTCKQVTLGEIIHAIVVKKADNLKSLAYFTEAGACCKCCKSPQNDSSNIKKDLYLSQILKKFS